MNVLLNTKSNICKFQLTVMLKTKLEQLYCVGTLRNIVSIQKLIDIINRKNEVFFFF